MTIDQRYNEGYQKNGYARNYVYSWRWWRFQRKSDGMWLSFDGKGATKDIRYSYLGNTDQAKNMAKKNPELMDRSIWIKVEVTKDLRDSLRTGKKII